MDYDKLAAEFLKGMTAFRRMKPQKHIDNALHGEMFVLGYIAMKGGDVNPGEISSNLNLSKGRTTVTLTGLERKGFITRQIDPANRSRIIIELTDKGRSFADEHEKHIMNHVKDMLAFLGEQDAKELVRIMLKMEGYTPFIRR